MPTPKSLLGKVHTRKNLEMAWKEVSRFARLDSHGMSDQTIKDFSLGLKANLDFIRTELIKGDYNFGLLRGATIKKKGGKKRPLRIADIRDRVVQRAIARILEKDLGQKFGLNNPASYAYIKKKSTKSAIKKMLELHQSGYSVILEADIIDFFGTVDTNKLLNEMVFQNLSDESLNQLIEKVFKMEVGNKDMMPEEDWELYPESAGGLPQGGYLSPLFSNIYLSDFDHSMIKNRYKLIRYADDFIVMCKTIEEAEDAYTLTRYLLEDKLGLKMHTRDDIDKKARTRIVKITQTSIQFLGIQFNGVRIWPDSEKRKKLSEKLSKVSSSSKNVIDLLTRMRNLIEGWIAAYGFTDLPVNYIKAIDNEVNIILGHSLKKFGWKLKSGFLSELQRENSGVNPISWYLSKIRINYKEDDRDIFSKYWSP